MNASELSPCPFCGEGWRWVNEASIGRRMIEGYAECSGCGARVGEGHIALDDDDLKPRIAAMVNARCERTCHNLSESGGTGLLCSECGAYTPWIADATHAFPARRCGNCGAKVVGR